MSATNRGKVRLAYEAYCTPAWCVHRLLERLPLPGGEWLEPCAGTGAIIRAVNRSDVRWYANELRTHQCLDALERAVQPEFLGGTIRTGSDFLIWRPGRTFSVVITNPPYSLALEFVQHAFGMAPFVLMLLRLNWLASHRRSGFLRDHMPDCYVLPNRPSFTEAGADATEYAWMVWYTSAVRREGRVFLLDETPREVRCPRKE